MDELKILKQICLGELETAKTNTLFINAHSPEYTKGFITAMRYVIADLELQENDNTYLSKKCKDLFK